MAGKNTSLISYYFNSKEGLYREVIKYLLARFHSDLGSLPVPASDAGEVAGRNGLRALFFHLLVEVEAHFVSTDPLRDAAASLFLSEVHRPKSEAEDLLKERFGTMVNGFRACIRAIRPDFSPADVDFWGITLQGACLSHSMKTGINRLIWSSADPQLSIEDMAERLTTFAFLGLVEGRNGAETPFSRTDLSG